jgi:hypothetical protein
VKPLEKHAFKKHERGTACALCGNGRGHQSHSDRDSWGERSACLTRPFELTIGGDKFVHTDTKRVPVFRADVIDGITGKVIAKDAEIPAHDEMLFERKP